MSSSRPAWMQAMFAEAYDAPSEAAIDAAIESWLDTMPATEGVEDAFDTVVAQGYRDTDEKPDAYTLQSAEDGAELNCAGRSFATAVLAHERHDVRTRPLVQYRGTAEDPVQSHLCLLADRRGDTGGRVYGSNSEADTLQDIEEGPYEYEILDENGFYGMYLAAQAYTHWNAGDKDTARAYGDRIEALDLDSPYLDARVAEMDEDGDDIIVA